MAKAVIPVILCGGSGTRMWPASRENHPKQFLNLMGDFSLLQNTMRRALRTAGVKADNLVTVTLGALKNEVHAQLSEMDNGAINHILCEPSARDTGAAVALAAAYIGKTFGNDTMMWILPADHHIGDENALATAFHHALKAAESDYLVTFGITPTRPETGYGYIRLGDTFEDGTAYKAHEFKEKPSLDTAKAYIAGGNYLWNSGMFLFSTAAVLEQFRAHAPEILDSVQGAMDAADDHREPSANHYSRIAKQPFDKAIMEKAAKVAIVPCNPEWSDIGSWESLWELREKDQNGNVLEGRIAAHDTKNCLIQVKDRLIGCVGLENLVIVDTGDAILIADRSNGDGMKIMVNGLKSTGCKEVVDPPSEAQPWSLTKSIDQTGYNVREIIVQPGESLALKMHAHKSKFWTALEGQGVVTFGHEKNTIVALQTAFIPAGVDYSIVNTGEIDLKIVEVCQDEQGNTIQFTTRRIAA